MKRLFVAIEIIPQPALVEKINTIRKSSTVLDKINWIDIENMHITLKFLGESHENLIGNIEEIIKKATQSTPAFQLQLNRIGAFGSRYQPRILWMGSYNQVTEIQTLHKKLEKDLHPLGFKPTYGNFVPHLTLARIHKIDNKKHFWKSIEQHQNTFDFQININEIILFESVLNKGYKPIYKKIKVFPLEANKA